MRDNLWPMFQQAVAAALSWWIADDLIDHHVPLFAPIATLVALNTPLGGRGSNTVRVLVGVITGVVVGDLAYALLGHGTAAFGLAVFAALLITLILDGERITMAQAAVGAVICVSAGRQAGTNRVLDALVGGAVALVFSQLLFPVHPVALLRRAESTTLSGLADALEFTARELDAPEEERTARTWEEVRTVYSLLDDLGRARADSISVAARPLHRRRDRRPLSREMAGALHLDLLGNSCFTLVRRALSLDAACQREFAPVLRDLSAALASFAAARAAGRCAVTRRAGRSGSSATPRTPDPRPPSRCGRTYGWWCGTSWSPRVPTRKRPNAPSAKAPRRCSCPNPRADAGPRGARKAPGHMSRALRCPGARERGVDRLSSDNHGDGARKDGRLAAGPAHLRHGLRRRADHAAPQPKPGGTR
ncbi:FUSC family protein [Streptomyces sp. NPDC047803]|uniref:FUSC family protein n=1 Tax=Streptomyces sp. NPDC047803 TaxID=3160976 RepID=UPI0033FC87E2